MEQTVETMATADIRNCDLKANVEERVKLHRELLASGGKSMQTGTIQTAGNTVLALGEGPCPPRNISSLVTISLP